MKKKKIMKQPSNITPLCWTTSMRKNKEKEKEKQKIKVKTEKRKKKKNKQKKHMNKKQLTIQNEERAKQTTYMAEQKEQKQYRG